MTGRQLTPRRAAGLALVGALALAACHQKPGTPANAVTQTNGAATASAANAVVPITDTADAADATAYLQSLYDHYKSSKNNSFQMFDANVREVFDADTIRLLDADEKALKGDLGVIDGDWLCDCQDFVSLKTTIAVQSASPTEARATSDFVDTGMPGQGARHDEIALVKENGRWRIHDIKAGDEEWLRKQLQDEIKSLGAKRPDSNEAA